MINISNDIFIGVSISDGKRRNQSNYIFESQTQPLNLSNGGEVDLLTYIDKKVITVSYYPYNYFVIVNLDENNYFKVIKEL